MRSAFALLALLYTACANAEDISKLDISQVDILIDDWTKTTPHAWSSEFEFEAPTIKIEGSAIYDLSMEAINLRGVYTSTQAEIVDDTNLSFQLYNAKGKLIQFENPRAAFSKQSLGVEAAFNYTIPVKSIGQEPEERQMHLKFNYVLEGKYWYHREHPGIDRLTIGFTDLQRSDSFEKRGLLVSPIVPVGTVSYSLSWIDITRSDQNSPFNFRQSIESYTEAFERLIDNPRKALPNKAQGATLLTNSFMIDELGNALVRQGFVWEGVRWYDNNKRADFKTIKAVSITSYSLFVIILLFVSIYSYKKTFQFAKPSLRTSCLAISLCSGGFAFLLLAFNRLGIFYTLVFLSFYYLRSTRITRPRFYAICVIPLIGLELYWSWAIPLSSVSTSGMALSILLYIILFLPLLLATNRAIRYLILGALTIGSIAMYWTMDVYYSFFSDYPALTVFGNANQLGNILDSVMALIEERHCIAIFIWGPSWLYLLIPSRLGKLQLICSKVFGTFLSPRKITSS